MHGAAHVHIRMQVNELAAPCAAMWPIVNFSTVINFTLNKLAYIYNTLDADVSSRCESLKGMSKRSELIPCIIYIKPRELNWLTSKFN